MAQFTRNYFLIVLVVAFLALTLQAEQLTNKPHQLEAGKIKYKPTQREDVRTYENSLPSGFLEGFLKMKMYGGGDCMSEGLTLARAYFGMIKTFMERGKSDDQRNIVQVSQDFQRKCNYGASFEGLVLSKVVSDSVSKQTWMSEWMRTAITSSILIYQVLNNFTDDFFALFQLNMAISTHKDLYNIGTLLGRMAKMVSQFYLQGWDKYLHGLI
eukprot:403347613